MDANHPNSISNKEEVNKIRDHENTAMAVLINQVLE